MANYFAFGFVAVAGLVVTAADYVTQSRIAGEPFGDLAMAGYAETVRTRLAGAQAAPVLPERPESGDAGTDRAGLVAKDGKLSEAELPAEAPQDVTADAPVTDNRSGAETGADDVPAPRRLSQDPGGACRTTSVGKSCSVSR